DRRGKAGYVWLARLSASVEIEAGCRGGETAQHIGGDEKVVVWHEIHEQIDVAGVAGGTIYGDMEGCPSHSRKLDLTEQESAQDIVVGIHQSQASNGATRVDGKSRVEVASRGRHGNKAVGRGGPLPPSGGQRRGDPGVVGLAGLAGEADVAARGRGTEPGQNAGVGKQVG